MPIVNNEQLETLGLPGLRHLTVARHEKGLRTMEASLQTLAPARGKGADKSGSTPWQSR